jgi:hypothetical protein
MSLGWVTVPSLAAHEETTAMDLRETLAET